MRHLTDNMRGDNFQIVFWLFPIQPKATTRRLCFKIRALIY